MILFSVLQLSFKSVKTKLQHFAKQVQEYKHNPQMHMSCWHHSQSRRYRLAVNFKVVQYVLNHICCSMLFTKPLTCSSVHFLMSPWLICRFDLKHCLMAWLMHCGAEYWVDLPLGIWKISPSILLWVMHYSLANLLVRLWNSFLPKTNLQGGAE